MNSNSRLSALAVFVLAVGIGKVSANPCELPVSSGNCTGPNPKEPTTRFYYSSVNFKCTEFPYSGCGGNANNFPSMEECKRQCQKPLAELPVLSQILAAQAEQKCHYGNRTYTASQGIPEATLDSPCSLGCFCDARPAFPARIICAEVDCPPYPDDGVDCVPINKEHTCCSEYHCPSQQQNPPEVKPFTCEYQGKSYVEGQSLDVPEYPCISCTCNKNFTGVLTTENGVCREVNCGILIHNQQKLLQKCVPKFYTTSAGKQSCCPIEWNCNLQVPKPKH